MAPALQACLFKGRNVTWRYKIRSGAANCPFVAKAKPITGLLFFAWLYMSQSHVSNENVNSLYTAPHLWNQLSVDIKSPASISTFKSELQNPPLFSDLAPHHPPPHPISGLSCLKLCTSALLFSGWC